MACKDISTSPSTYSFRKMLKIQIVDKRQIKKSLWTHVFVFVVRSPSIYSLSFCWFAWALFSFVPQRLRLKAPQRTKPHAPSVYARPAPPGDTQSQGNTTIYPANQGKTQVLAPTPPSHWPLTFDTSSGPVIHFITPHEPICFSSCSFQVL